MIGKQATTLISLLTTERLLLIIFLISASVAIQAYGPDVYLHLTTGRYILEIGKLSHIDVFSFTRYGEPWVMHEWLYQIVFYSLHEAYGPIGLQIVSSSVLTATLYLNKKNCNLVGASDITAWISTIITFVSWYEFVCTRPHIFTYLFFTLSLHFILLHRHQGAIKPLYIMPLIMVAWVNIHGGFLVGIVLLGYITLLTFIENYANTKRWVIPKHLFNSLLLTTVASLINPYGVQQLLFPFRLMEQWAMQFVPEWLPPDFTAWNYALFACTAILFVLASLWMRTDKRWFNLVLAAPFIVAAFDAVRHVPIAAFIISPYFAANMSFLLSQHIRKQPHAAAGQSHDSSLRRINHTELGIVENILNWILLCLFCMATYLAYPIMKQKKHEIFKRQFPVGATEYLADNHIHGRLFTTMQYSDYILFHRYPEQKVFYDVRIETYGRELSFDFMKMVSAQGNWEELFRKYNIDYVVLDKKESPISSFATNHNYHILYEDEYSIIFSREEHD
jgi:hypothetical protein